MDSDAVWLRDGPLGRITFNRPEHLNAWNESMGRAVLEALRGPAADSSVRAVVITGAGRAFSAGADLAGWSADDGGPPDIEGAMTDLWNPLVLALRTLEKPVVASVNGAAAGFGASLVLACDFTLMAQSAFLQFAFSRVGLMPDGGASLLLPEAIGRARAARVAMLGERVGAAEAVDWGLAHAAHPDGELADATDAFAHGLATGPTRAHAATKAGFDRVSNAALAEHLAFEAGRQRELMGTADFAEGVRAFEEKRSPGFEGR